MVTRNDVVSDPQEPPPMHIGLLWHAFGHNNLGVDALSRANAALLERAAARAGVTLRFTTLGSGQQMGVPDLPANVRIGPGPSIKQALLLRSEFLRDLRSCDMVVDIGEGDSFTDIYGRSRFLFQTATKAAAILLRKPLVLAPQTIGPFDHAAHRWLATRVINRTTATFARDHLSTAFLHDLGVTAPIDEFIDVAFALPFDAQPATPGVTRVGINVSGLLFNGGYSGQNELGMALDYAAFTRATIAALTARPGVQVALFAHVSGGGGPDDDWPAVQQLGRAFPGVEVIAPFATSIAAKSWMSGLDFVAAGRMHACIGAFSAGVPVVPVAYSRKFNGLFETLHYPHFIDGKATTTDAAITALMQAFDARTTLKSAINASRPIIADRVKRYEDFLTAQLTKIAQERR